MKLQQLRYAIEIGNTGSITKAAANLFMSQPNLSNALRELESEIGITVFARTPKGVEPTADGREFLSYARSVVAQVDRMEFIFKNQKRDAVSLSVACVPSSHLMRILCQFYSEQPKGLSLDLKITETTPVGVLEAVARSEADVGRIVVPEQNLAEYRQHVQRSRLVMELMWKAKAYVLLSAESPLADEDILSFDMLKGYTCARYAGKEYDAVPSGDSSRSITVTDRGAMMDVLSSCHDSYLWTVSTHPDIMKTYNLVAKPCRGAPSAIEAIVYSKDKPKTQEVLWLLDKLRSSHRNEYLQMQEPFEMETVL